MDYKKIMDSLFKENFELEQQCEQYKTENEQLKEENGKLETQKIAFQRSYKEVYEENKDLKHENKALRLQADTYFDEWQNAKKRIEELEKGERKQWSMNLDTLLKWQMVKNMRL